MISSGDRLHRTVNNNKNLYITITTTHYHSELIYERGKKDLKLTSSSSNTVNRIQISKGGGKLKNHAKRNLNSKYYFTKRKKYS